MKKLLACLSLIGILLGSQPAQSSGWDPRRLIMVCSCCGNPTNTVCPKKTAVLSIALATGAIIMHYGYGRAALFGLGSAATYMSTQAYEWWNQAPAGRSVSGSNAGSHRADDDEFFAKGRR